MRRLHAARVIAGCGGTGTRGGSFAHQLFPPIENRGHFVWGNPAPLGFGLVCVQFFGPHDLYPADAPIGFG